MSVVVVQLQDLLQRLSGAQQLVQRVLDLETTNSQQAASITSLQQQLLSSEQQVGDLSSQLAAWHARGSRAERQLDEAQQQLGVSTPRPERELGLLTDLLTAAEAQLVEQALIAGEQQHPLYVPTIHGACVSL
jgi:septal ring factor EnvC (AmiA/AmiB activator)